MSDAEKSREELLREVAVLRGRIEELKASEDASARTASALRESESRYALATAAGQVGVWDWDLATGDVFLDDQIKLMLGFRDHEVQNRLEAWSAVLHPDDLQRITEALNAHLAGMTHQLDVEHRVVGKYGGVRWVLARGTALRDASGKPDRMVGTLTDISELKRTEEALGQEREKFRILVEESPFGVALIDRNGTYRYINPRFTEILGYTLEEVPTGREWFERAFPDPVVRRKAVAAWKENRWRGTSEAPASDTFVVCCADGSRKVIKFRNVSMGAEGDFVLFEDVTEQRTLHAQLLQSQKMEAIGTLAGGIAHDFNNILAGIMGYAELTSLELPGWSKAKQNLKKVLKAGDRARDLVKQILTFSREADQEREAVQILPLVKETLKFLRASLPATIEIRQEIEGEPQTIEADPTQIHQVLMNLCTNAAHAMGQEGGVLTVGLANVEVGADDPEVGPDLQAGAYLRLSVSDTGHGMAAEVQGRIFDPYFTTKGKSEGTGLGLAVVHGIVKAHGGAVRLRSAPQQGARFDVYLPALEAGHRQGIEGTASIPTGTERVLFVDDEDFLVDVAQQMLEYLGYEVTTQTSSTGALAVFQREPDRYDLVITDLTMPHMTGVQLTRELRRIREDIPVIVCSGLTRGLSDAEAADVGVKAFVVKPLVLRELAVTVRRVLDEQAGRVEPAPQEGPPGGR